MDESVKRVTRPEVSNHIKTILFKAELEAAQRLSDAAYEVAGESLKTDDSIDFSDSTETKSNVENEASDGKENVWMLPLPPDVFKRPPTAEDDYDGYSISTADSDQGRQTTASTDASTVAGSSSNLTEGERKEMSEKNASDMKIILEILYRIFGRLWVFREIQAVFHTMPTVEKVDLPFELHVPKPKFKEEIGPVTKLDKPGKKPVVPTKTPEEMETERQLHKNDYILPLQASEEAKAYMKMVLTSERSLTAKGGKGGKK